MVSVHLLTDAGAAGEDEEQGGIAALTAQLLVTGTRRLDAAAFAETTERLGIEVGSESGWDSARAGFTALGAKLDDGLALLAEMIRTPRLDEREFERLKAERLNDILQARADPGRLADERFSPRSTPPIPIRTALRRWPATVGVDRGRRQPTSTPAGTHQTSRTW